MSEVVQGDYLILNRELEGIAGVTITAMSQPGGFAVLLRGEPIEPADYFLVTVYHRPCPAGEDQITLPAVLMPQKVGYDFAIFTGVAAPNVISVLVSPVKSAGCVVGFVVHGERLPEAMIGLG